MRTSERAAGACRSARIHFQAMVPVMAAPTLLDAYDVLSEDNHPGTILAVADQLASALRDALKRLDERQTELLAANNVEVERRRAAEARATALESALKMVAVFEIEEQPGLHVSINGAQFYVLTRLEAPVRQFDAIQQAALTAASVKGGT